MTKISLQSRVHTLRNFWRKTPISLAAMTLLCLSGQPTAWAQGKVIPPSPDLRQAGKPKVVPPLMALKNGADVEENIPNVELTREYMYAILGSELAAQQGQYGLAYRTYMRVARETKDPRLARRAVELAISGKLQGEALEGARLWRQISPRSTMARQILELMLITSNRWDELPPLLKEQLRQVSAEKQGEAILNMQMQLSRNTQTKGVVTALEGTLDDKLNLPESHYALARAQFLANDKPAAIASLEQAIKLKSDYEPAILLLADIDDAHREANIQRLQHYVKRAPQPRDARLMLAKLLVATERYDAAQAEFEKVHQAQPKDGQVIMALALLDMQRKNLNSAEKRLKDYLVIVKDTPVDAAAQTNNGAVVPGKNAAYQYLAQIAEQRKDYAAASQWLQQIDDPEMELGIKVKLAQYQVAQGHLPQALEMIREVRQNPRIQKDPQLSTAMAKAEIGLLVEGKSFDKALEQMDWLLVKSPKDVDVLFESAMTLERLGKYDEMEVRLRKVIALNPEHALALNALGYSLADRNIRLPEAKTLIEKAIALAPKEAMIIDSLGWLKYRMGDSTGAVPLLEAAYAKQADVEIGAHLGEVLWQQGLKAEAIKVWDASEKTDKSNAVLKATRQRLQFNEVVTPSVKEKP